MTEYEICRMYREAKRKTAQIQILQELTGKGRLEVLQILSRNGEQIPQKIFDKLADRLDELEDKIKEYEREYKEIAKVFLGK